MELDISTRDKFDAVLERVKEPLTELTLAELNLVEKITYSASGKTLSVHLAASSPRHECPACSAMNGEVIIGIERMLSEELLKEFPGFTVQFV